MMTAVERQLSSHDHPLAESDLEALRQLLLGDDYHKLLQFKKNTQDHHKHSQSIANIISEALAIRSKQDDSIAEILAPTLQSALTRSIGHDPEPIADALYPIMGPAIRKSINEALTHMLDTFNQLLEQSLSLKSILWRLDAWRTGRSYSEVILLKTLLYQVEEVFLIHRMDGLLLQHASLDTVISQDGDIVSGMLTAIQDFIHDSFSVEEGENTSLSTLRLGDLTVVIKQGPQAVLAAVIRGNAPESIHVLLASILETIHHQHGEDFICYHGDSSPFDRSQPLLQQCLQVQTLKRTATRLPLFFILALLAVATLYWGYSAYQQQQQQQRDEWVALQKIAKESSQWQIVLHTLRSEPGLIVINAERNKQNNKIEVLLDRLARKPRDVINDLPMSTSIVFKIYPYLSLDDAIILLRTKQLFEQPERVSFAVKKGVLSLSGMASLAWVNNLKEHWQQVVGLQQLNVDNLQHYDQNLPAIRALKQKIEQSRVFFEKNNTALNQNSHADIKSVSRLVKELIPLTEKSKIALKISLTGNTDQSGSEIVNDWLALQRVARVEQALTAFGVPEHLLTNAPSLSKRYLNERSVHYQIILDH
jgi:OOP family OmpA-OmpF porin